MNTVLQTSKKSLAINKSRINRGLALILISVLSLTWINAQNPTQTFRGRVLDSYTKHPLPGATLIIEGSDPVKGTITDAEGMFRFDKLPAGRLNVKVNMIGYKPVLLPNLLLNSGRELVLDISLEEQVYNLGEVTVKPAIRKDQAINEMAVVSARSFTIDETERFAGSLGDPSRMATNYAGVSSVSDQRNDIIIRGNSPLSLLWRLEDVDIPNPNHFGSLGSTGGPMSMLNNNQLTNSDFYSSAFPAAYGNAISGVFDLKMRNGNNQKHEYMGQIGFNGFELGAEGPFTRNQRSSFMINVRYSTLEVLKSMGMSFGTGAAVPKYKDVSFKLNFPLKKGRISVFGLGGDNSIAMLDSEGDDAQYGFRGTDLYNNNFMGVLGMNYVHNLNSNTILTNTVAATGISTVAKLYDLATGLDRETVNENMSEYKYIVSSKYSKRFNAANYLNTGITLDIFSSEYYGAQYHKRIDKTDIYLDASGKTGLSRFFMEWQHRFSDNLSLTSGIHSSYFFLNGSKAAEPRLGLKWSFAKDQSLNIGAGMHSQLQMKAVYFNQRLIDTAAMRYERTNKNLDLSRSLHFVAGYDLLFGREHRLKTEVYYQKLYDIPVAWRCPQFSLLSQGGGYSFTTYDNMENLGIGENIGIEITLEKFLHNGFYYLLTASVFDAGYRGYDGIWRNSSFNNNYVFNVLSGYEWKFGSKSLLSVDMKMVYVGGNRYLEIDQERSAAAGGVRYKWDEAYQNRYPAYFRLNGRITYRLNTGRINNEWALDLQNITNRRNIFIQNWNNETGEISTSYQMSFMPMITYRIYF